MQCVECGGEFEARKNTKTCSPVCSKKHRLKRERAYNTKENALRRMKREHEWKSRTVVIQRRPNLRVARAVRLLFALTGEQRP